MLVRCCPPYNCRHGRWTTVTAAKLASIWREDNVRSHQIGESATCKCYGVHRCYRCKGAVRTHVPQAQAPERVPAQLHRVPARVEVRHVQKPPTADRRRRAGPKALPVVAHGRSGAAKIDKIGRPDCSDHRRSKSRRPAKLLPRIGAVGPVLKRYEPSPTAAQEPRKSTKSDAPTAPTTAARRVDARRNSSRGSAPSGRS